MATDLVCDYCGGGDLSFAWSREFTVSEHGWEGVHEYWHCNGCSGGYFSVRDINGVILFPSSPPPSSGRGFTGCAW